MMTDETLDLVVMLFFTVIPLTLILLQIFFSTRKKLILGFIVPFLWSLLCVWILLRGKSNDRKFSLDLVLFFLLGDAILFGILALVKYLKNRKKNNNVSVKEKK